MVFEVKKHCGLCKLDGVNDTASSTTRTDTFQGVGAGFVLSQYPRLVKSMECIRQWARCGIAGEMPYGRNVAECLKDIEREADAAISSNLPNAVKPHPRVRTKLAASTSGSDTSRQTMAGKSGNSSEHTNKEN